jgi:hypothetical protein
MGNLRWEIPSKGEIVFSPVKLPKRIVHFCSSRVKSPRREVLLDEMVYFSILEEW